MASRKCLNNPNYFCYICGDYTFCDERLSVTPLIQHRFHCYFKFKMGDQDKNFAPHTVCRKCSSNLSMWSAGKLKKLPFSTPMAWREQANHYEDCYFCMINVKGFTKKSAKHIMYPNLSSAIRPVPYEESEDPPKPTDTISSSTSTDNGDDSEEYMPENDKDFKGITQVQLDHFIKRLGLSKDNACLAASMLKDFGALAKETKVSVYRQRDLVYQKYFKQDEKNNLVYCCDISGLLCELGIAGNVSTDWWLFIDGSVQSLKAVLLHVEKKYPGIPVAYGRQIKESYEMMKTILGLMKYEHYKMKVGGDLKVVGMLTGMQQGYTKFCCFLCLWDSRDRQNHYTTNEWPSRTTRVPGRHSIKFESLVNPEDILLPPLHIKLGIFKQFIKALDSEGEPLKIVKNLFPTLSEGKIKEGVFVGPQLNKLMKSDAFKLALNKSELRAWDSLLETVKNFLGKHRSDNYRDIVAELLDAFADMKVF
jgi:hypothetical protein